MSLSLLFDPKPTYLHVSVTGIFALPEANSLFLRILDACTEFRLTKVLVDFRSIQGSLTTSEAFQYGKFISLVHASYADKGLPPVRLAYLGAEPFVTRGEAAEIAALNRSLDVKVTTSVDEALNWLSIDLSG